MDMFTTVFIGNSQTKALAGKMVTPEDTGMYKVLLFAGTAEGRKIAEYLKELGVPALASAATEYGRSLLEEGEAFCVRGTHGRGEMERLFAGEDALVVDATHPYASAVTENIRSACEKPEEPI